ncbi:hypothetical protein EGW08_023618 [Elysia chlorotica]|uniref:Uncharacterized protein n=1 Tax=Elysia chlorotica TaxID=188477 RepID=A0A3S1APY9_ELYCH|nr:hypothetical protein EGW08_023618 [Elysia chlorotica]
MSACRKENYLIIRDSCHRHSHPCNEEIYSMYPEVRRMSKDEKSIVGSLMELGVPSSQIKSAVGRQVTPKDLQNARSQVKAIKNVTKVEQPDSVTKISGTILDMEDAERSDNKLLHPSEESSSVGELPRDVGEVGIPADTGDSNSYIVSVGSLQDSLHGGLVVEDGGEDRGEASVLDSSGLSGLLAAAGINSDSVVVTMNSQAQVKEEEAGIAGNSTAYSVTLCLPGGEVCKKGNNLQELLKDLPLGKIVSKVSLNATLPEKEKESQDEKVLENYKLCVECKGYISPLDPHDHCLTCLGPEHIQEENCESCKGMSQEQYNIRRKRMVALRMKALKALQQKRKLEEMQKQERLNQASDELEGSDSDFATNGQRRSKRARKPKSFGPDVSIEHFGRKRKACPVSSENSDAYFDPVVKSEPLHDYEDGFVTSESEENTVGNGERFAHILSQTAVFDDVVCSQLEDGVTTYSPGQDISRDFNRLVRAPDLPAVPPSLLHKYRLDPRFEAEFCSPPEPLSGALELIEPGMDVLNKGLCKLAVNAVTNTRLAIYDKLFTRLGVGMADEALSILTELYGRVTQVTEISQEDLTSNLQTAVDTIQALKDVLEELGVMSTDAAQTAAYQRSISLQSLNNARASLRAKLTPRDTGLPRRAKFTPFSTKKLSACSLTPSSSGETAHASHELAFPQEEIEVPSSSIGTASVESLSSAQTEASSSAEAHEMPIMSVAGPHSTIEVATEQEPSFINMENKIYSVTPMAISSELFQTLNNSKDSAIENVGW